MDSRQESLTRWCAQQCNMATTTLETVSGDASFRRYFRVFTSAGSRIAMDAPPEKEDSSAFIHIAKQWRAQGIQVPAIIAHDLSQGFVLLEDFGNDVLLDTLNPKQPSVALGDQFYAKAIDALIEIQTHVPVDDLPPYDAALLDREMALFTDWLLDKKLEISRSPSEDALIHDAFSRLRESALAQTQTVVHRDYHSRNLMICEDQSLGILDFQDAVRGPITYDLVSLLRDCYICWPIENVERWCDQYWQLAQREGICNADQNTFQRWFDWMGIQRHLKAAGIFARLSLRDGKHGYLADIPQTVGYIAQVSARYRELRPFHDWLVDRVVPRLNALTQDGR